LVACKSTFKIRQKITTKTTKTPRPQDNINMKQPLKFLFVEDVSADAELIFHEISKSGIDFEKRLVDNKIDFLAAMKSFEPDLIISDYSLPQFDGLSALFLRNELTPSTPFILVTGSINEEIAVESMKAGADDYVIKQNLSRLGPAIMAAMKKKEIYLEKEQAEKALQESEELIKTFINTNRDIMFVKDDKLRYIIVNEGTLRFFNLRRDQILFKTDFELVDSESAEFCLKSDKETLEKNALTVYEEVVAGKIFETTKFPLKLRENKTGLGAIIRDITDTKNAEKALKQKIEELEQFNDLTVNREIKMIELKKEVNMLLKQTGSEEKYKIVE
jgi:PAS domain S-box-containing protein